MEKSRLLFGLLIVLATISYSCDRKERNVEVTSLSDIVVEKNATTSDLNNEGSVISNSNSIQSTTPVYKKKIIKDGNISIKSNDIAESKKGIDELVKKYNAYYNSEELQNDDRIITYNLKIRIPSENFEKFISQIENGKDEISNKSIHSRDVTAEFVDVEARLNNKREYLKRYKDLLSKAASVKDIIAIEENIRTLQEEIESKEGQLKYLSDQVAYSTLDISLYKENEYIYKAKQKDKFTERVKDSISNGWSAIIGFLLWLISLWPFIILALAATYIFRSKIRKRKVKHQENA
jgi:hypothetical protein